MDREKITELALAAGFEEKLLSNGEMGLREYVYDFAKEIEREILGRSHFVRLPSGGYIRGDEITAVRKLDGEKCGQTEFMPRIVVDFGMNCIVIDCESDSIRNNMADAIMRDIDAAVAAIKGRDAQELLDAAIVDARHFETQRNRLLEFVEEVRRSGDTRLASMAIAVISSVKGDHHG